WQPRKDSNLRMPESESGALPLGDGAVAGRSGIIPASTGISIPVAEGSGDRAGSPPLPGPSPGRDGPSSASALGELRGAAGLVQADLLALDLAGVAGHEAGLAQVGLQRLVVLDQRAGDAQADRTGLAGGAAAGGGDDDVELVDRLGQLERLAHDHARGLAAEELVQRTAVDGDVATALAQEHAGGGGLATASAVVLSGSHRCALDVQRLRLLRRVRVFGTGI